MKFGENLRKIRKELEITQEELSDKLHVPVQTISKWEKSESYPESVDIEELCNIFNCKLDDLLNEKTKDLKSFDKELIKKVKNFKEEQANNIKAISHIICLACNISKIVLFVAIPFILIAMLIVPYVVNNIDVVGEDIVLKTDNIEFVDEDEIEVFRFLKIDFDENISLEEMKNIFRENTKLEIVLYVNAGLLYMLFDIILITFILKFIEKLFENFIKGETPFTLVNINYIKYIAYLLIAIILVSPVSNFLLGKLLDLKNIGNPIDLIDIFIILVIYGMSYVFEYGYGLEKDKLRK